MKQIRTWVQSINRERQEQMMLLVGAAAAVMLLLVRRREYNETVSQSQGRARGRGDQPHYKIGFHVLSFGILVDIILQAVGIRFEGTTMGDSSINLLEFAVVMLSWDPV